MFYHNNKIPNYNRNWYQEYQSSEISANESCKQEEYEFKKEIHLANRKARRMEPSKLFDIGDGAIGVGPAFPLYGLISPFWNGDIVVSLYVGSMEFAF